MKRKRRKMREMMDFMEFIRETTRFLSDAQYLDSHSVDENVKNTFIYNFKLKQACAEGVWKAPPACTPASCQHGALVLLLVWHFNRRRGPCQRLTLWSWRFSADAELEARWCRRRFQAWRNPTEPRRCCRQSPADEHTSMRICCFTHRQVWK